MRTRLSPIQRLAVGFAALAIVSLGMAVAYAQNAPGKGKVDVKEPVAKPEPKKGDASKARIKVFRLTHIDLETITRVLNNLLPESVDVAPAVAVAGGAHGIGGLGGLGLGGGLGGVGLGGGLGGLGLGGGLGGVGLGGGLGGQIGGLGGLGLGGGAGGGMLGVGGGPALGGGGMFGALGGTGLPNAGSGAMSWRFTEDPRTKSLIVRGPEKVIAIVADLVAVLDLPADKPMPVVKNLRAYRLKHAKAEEIFTVLTNLELDARIADAKENVLIVAGSEEIIKEIDGVIEALDVDVPKPKDSPVQKKNA